MLVAPITLMFSSQLLRGSLKIKIIPDGYIPANELKTGPRLEDVHYGSEIQF